MTQTVFVSAIVVLFVLVCLPFWLKMWKVRDWREDEAQWRQFWEDWGGRK